LATGTFSSGTSSGWQTLNFSAPVAIAPNTTYISSYHSAGPYYASSNYFGASAFDNAPLHALKDGTDGSNGVYANGAGTTFPNASFQATNYWADVVFVPGGSTTPQSVLAYSGTPQSATIGTTFGSTLQVKVVDASSYPVAGVAVTFTAPSTGASATFGGATIVNTNALGIATSPILTANSTTGSYNVTGAVSGIATPATFNMTNLATGITVFGTTAPTTFYNQTTPVEVGMKFRSDVNGAVTGVRFYKGSTDSTTHTGTLWSSTGTLLATGTFTGGTASGWQTLNFSSPVAINANTTYVVSTHSGGPYYASAGYFTPAGFDTPPLHALKDGVDGPDGVFVYGAGGVFPNLANSGANYWVDVMFVPN
jgi:hypothetical protein